MSTSSLRATASASALAIAAALAAMVSIQFGAALAKQLFPLVGAPGATALRLAFATVVLLVVWRPWRRPPRANEWRTLALYGCSLGAMNLLFYLALARIPLGIAVALEFSGPLAIALLNTRRKRDVLWAVLAASGILALSPASHLSAPLDGVGVALALSAGACWAAYILFGQRAGDAVHGGTAATIGMCFAALVTVPYGVAVAGTALLDWRALPFGLGIGVLSSALPYSLEMVALKAIPTRTFGVLMSVEPAIAAVSGWLFLREQLSAVQWLAIAAVIAASVGSTVSGELPEIIAA